MCRLRFWQDHWCVNAPLCAFFPDIFEIARDKDVIVAGAWSRSGAGGYWDILFLRSFNDWEVDSVASLLILYRILWSLLKGKRLDGRRLVEEGVLRGFL